jgi:hypothetical protein
MQETFYATFAQVSFGLLGLWWVVVQFRHREFMTDPSLRRTSLLVSMYFALPAIMSLLSLLAVDATFIWRIAFASAGVVGVVLALRSALGADTGWGQVSSWLGVALFGFVTVVALTPDLVRNSGVSLTPIQVEGIALSMVLLVGVVTAWRMFTAATDEHVPPAGPPPA